MAGLPEIDEAAEFIRSRTALRPTLAVVLGSGLGAFVKSLQDPAVVPYAEIPHFPLTTAVGHPGVLAAGLCQGVPLLVMAGRVHHYEGYSMAQVVFPIRVLGRLGVKVLVLTNAAGSINTGYQPGELMVIEDHINLMGTNPLIGPNQDALGPRFFDMSDAYDPELRQIAEKAGQAAGITVRKGVYLAVSGPSYETPAEIRMGRLLGADAVGMSTVPEVIAARHMNVRVLGLSCITNMAAGVLKTKLDHQEVLDVGERVKGALLNVLGQIVQEAARA